MNTTSAQRKTSKWLRRIILIIVALVLLVVAAELVGQFALGLGDPPQTIRDDDMEYRLKPSSEYRRFGRRIAHNRFSMRSDDFPEKKSQPNELRIMVLGDSIINGGEQCDQDDLATELLRERLAEKYNRPVTVGNIAAGSWGPPNLWGYIQKFGLFDADIVIVVVNSGDAWDVPQPREQSVAGKREPKFALEELYMEARKRMKAGVGAEAEDLQTPERAALSLGALEQVIQFAQRQGAPVGIVLHFRRDEVGNSASEGAQLFERFARERGIPFTTTESAYRGTDSAVDPAIFRDVQHLSSHGQRVLADVLLDVCNELVAPEEYQE